MKTKLLTFEEFIENGEKTVENARKYTLYIKENNKQEWVNKIKSK